MMSRTLFAIAFNHLSSGERTVEDTCIMGGSRLIPGNALSETAPRLSGNRRHFIGLLEIPRGWSELPTRTWRSLSQSARPFFTIRSW